MTDAPPARPFVGLVYRAHNPRWAFAPISGDGAARHGGRFNARGTPALYTSLDPKTAWMEAQQGLPFKAQPMTLVGYRVRCERVIDLADPVVLAAHGIDAAALACAWEDLTSRGAVPPSWSLASDLIAAGWHGAVVPSLAPGTTAAERNLVLWRWSDTPPCQVLVIDDFGRLPQDDGSWV